MTEAVLHNRKRHVYTIIFLVLINLVVFGQTITFDFISYDDQTYILDNPEMEKGLTWETFKWGLTTGYFVSWHPVTWWSFLLDAKIYGLEAGGFHATNVIIHILATIALFYALFRMTTRYWESLIVAALFAIHPQHVQSVAWIAERKDVLSALFMSLTFLAYHRYTQNHRARWYLMTMFMFALGLMSKSMLVTLPCVLFLLDYWPLNRLGDRQAIKRALLEKIPLMALTITTAVITFRLQDGGGATATMERFGILGRILNALNSYTAYLYRTVWPAELSFFYPLDRLDLPIIKGVLSALFLIALSIVVWKKRRTAPQLITGWCWYLGTLVPVIGIVQVGQQASADRYTYIPLIGIFIAVVYTLYPWLQRNDLGKRICRMGSIILLATLMLLSYKETGFWKDSGVLTGRAYDLNKGNFVACHILGNIHREYKSYEHAERFYRECLVERPNAFKIRLNLAQMLKEQDKVQESYDELRQCYAFEPANGHVLFQLGVSSLALGRADEARNWYALAIEAEGAESVFFVNYANLISRQGDLVGALKAYDQAIALDPASIPAYHNKASALFSHYQSEEALLFVKKALQIQPDYAPSLALLAAIESELSQKQE